MQKGITIFPWQIFDSVPENFVEEPFCVSKNFCLSKNVKDKRGGGGYQDFPSKIFCLTMPKNFVEEPFCAVFQEISGSQKVYG